MISRTVYPKRQGRRWLTALSLLTLVSSLLLTGSTALAVHSDGLFELDTNSSQAICTPVTAPCGDANVADSPAGGADDWADVFNNTDVAFGSTFIPDPVGDVENSYFTGGGSKDERDIPDWQYATANDVVPDKDDIAHAFAAAYVNPADNHTHIYFGDDRFDNNGSAETGFWFFQNRVALGANGRFTGTHRVGDVLVLANWGGSNPVGQVTVYQWVGGRSPLALVFDSTTADCAKVGVNDNVCAVVNRQNVAQPWGFLDKSGSTVIRPLELFEAGLDVTALFGADRCFASFLANTRSSHSTTAQLKDFALGGFEQCGASISISPSAVNEVGESHTFTVNVSKTVAGAPSPAAGVFPTVTLTTANGAVVANKVDNCATTGTDASGNCTVTFTSNSAGTVTGNASATVTIGTETFNVSTDGVSPNSGPAVKRFVDAWIQIDPDDVNEAGDSHTFTITAKQNSGDGTGFVSVPNGTAIDVDLTDSAGAVSQISANTCASTTNGTCSVTFTSQTGGIVSGHASIDLTLFGNAVHRETDASGQNSNDAVKKFVDAWITIAPDDVNETGDPHTFTVTVKQDGANGSGFVNVPDGTIVDVSLTNSGGATNSPSANTCATGTVAGQCTITFTSPTGGVVTGHAEVDLTLQGLAVHRETDGTAPNSGDAVKKFVDAWITISPDDVNETGDPHTFTVTVKQDSANGSGLVNVPNGTIVDVTLTDALGAISNVSSNTCETTGTVNGQCSVTFTSATGGTVTGTAAVDLTLQGLAVHRETDGNGLNSGPAVKRFVDATITIDPDATNEVGDEHTFTVTVQQDSGDGAGLVNVPNGTLVAVTLTDALGADSVVSLNSCALGGTVAGVCWVTFTSATGGTVTGHAAVDLTLAGLAVHRETDGVAPNSNDAVKTFVDAWITITPDATNETGDPHTFTVTAKQDSGDGNGFVNVPDGTIVTVTLTDDDGAAATGVVDGCALGATAGTCTVSFTSATGGTVTGHAAIDLTLAALAVHRETDGVAPNSDDAVKTFVDAYITINPPEATNTVGDPHTFTVNVQQDSGDGNGFVDVPDGTIVTVTLTPSAGATIGLIDDTCDGPGTVGGECTVTFSSSTTGTVTGHASVDLTLATLAVHRETDGIAPNSGDAVKHFVAGGIRWSKVDNAGQLQGGATFEVCKTHDFTLPSGPFVDLVPDQCVSVADNGPLDQDDDDGEFLLSGLSLGRYTVRETIAPPGFVADPDTVTVELSPGNTDVTIGQAFVNSREVLKITGFGYTNAPVGTPTSGVVNGIATFTVTLHNYGTAPANLTSSSLVVSGATCTGGNTLNLTGTIAAGADSPTYTLVCEYDGADGDVVQADLVVKSTTNGLEREASGSPARITFTIQAD